MNRALLRAFAFLSALFITFSLVGCENDSDGITYKNKSLCHSPAYTNNKTALICNRIRSLGKPPFSLPTKAKLGDGEFHKYENVSKEAFESFVSKIRDKGFECVDLKTGKSLFRDDCAVFTGLSQESVLTLSWIQRSRYAPKNGLSEADAKKLLCPEKSLSKIDLHPIDVTPKDFFDRAGAQIFAVPTYSFDEYNSLGYTGMMFDDNERYRYDVFVVKNGKAYNADTEKIAVFDVDGDGTEEICFLSYGLTSGVFSFDLTMISGDNVSETCFYPHNDYSLSFVETDGTVKVRGEKPDPGEDHYFDIGIAESIAGENIPILSENGVEMFTFSRPYQSAPES
jgi:hypothetical protein